MLNFRFRVVVALIVLLSGICAASESLTLKVDDQILSTAPTPIIRNGRVYVPITAFRKMGLYVSWEQGDKTGTVAWPETDAIYCVTAGQDWVPGQMKGIRIALPGAPFMSGGQLMLPLRTPVEKSLSVSFFQIDWDATNHVVSVRRSKAWLERRRAQDADLKAASPGCYETPM